MSDQSANVFAFVFLALILGLSALLIASMWRIFAKAGKPGWASLIPVYNIVVLLDIIGRPWWYLVFAFIPPTIPVLAVILMFGLARSFGRGVLFAIGMIFVPFICIPVLGFGGAAYIGGMGPSYRRGPAIPRQIA